MRNGPDLKASADTITNDRPLPPLVRVGLHAHAWGFDDYCLVCGCFRFGEAALKNRRFGLK